MQGFFDVGPAGNLVVFGIPLIGVNADTGRKLLLSLIAVLVVALSATFEITAVSPLHVRHAPEPS